MSENVGRAGLQALNDVARNTALLFSDNEDIEQISKVHSALEAVSQTRAKEVDGQRDLLRTLSRQFEAQKAACARPATAPSEKQHQEHLTQLDQRKFALGKTIASLEQELGAKEGQLALVKEDAGTVEHLDETEAFGQDTEVLRLKVYRDLGFLPIRDTQGHFAKIIVSRLRKWQGCRLGPIVRQHLALRLVKPALDSK